MNILKNKHLILAMFIAPVLAIIAWFGVDYIVAEKPHAARSGKTYKLAAKPNCRYQSGSCTLENGDIEVRLQAHHITNKEVELDMHSSLPIQHAVISSVMDNIETEPVVMRAASIKQDNWRATLALLYPEKARLRLALNISGSLYYAETSAVFIDYDTPFSRENFSR